MAMNMNFVVTPQILGQCGGQGWTGPTTCVSGSTCTYSNPWYSQCLPGSGGGTTAPVTTTTTPPPTNTQTFKQPIIWQDLADLDVFRVGDTYYYSASTMHYSPGAPILRSYDLVNWEYVGHSVPTLDWDSKYSLTNGARAYVKGIWASSLRYRKSNGLFYWIGCIEFSKTYVYTSPNAGGPWTRHGPINNCYYDAGLLIDETTDTIYVAYGGTTISVAQLSSDGFSQVRAQTVFTSPSNIGTIEGSRMYRINNNYYIAVTQPTPGGEYILKSNSGTPWGPYTIKKFVRDVGNPVPGALGPHQGGIVDTPDGRWYYIGFVDAYPGGRIPVMLPFTWGSDGFPVPSLVNGQFGSTYNYPLPARPVKSPFGTDSFTGSSLSHEWEWNHNPDTTKFSVGNGLKLSTASVTTDFYNARNTLTRRIVGPQSTATIILDYSGMRDGDRAGLALVRHKSAWIGIKKDNGGARVVFITGVDMNTSWVTTSTGSEAAAGGSIPSTGRIWLRVAADIRPGNTGSKQGLFSYSTNGNTFTRLGGAFSLNTEWQFFLGYRFGILNYATSALGGSVTVSSFTISAS
ncbi:family 43 glycosyl hydrolase [Panaeolus papilionaceus]|nr:family 43 glycosyl hydrolase [Panaeolus papilionaceus]